MAVKFKKNRSGEIIVNYECMHCGASLRSIADEIDCVDQCPKCGGEFIVPGREEYKKLLHSLNNKTDAEKPVAESEAQAVSGSSKPRGEMSPPSPPRVTSHFDSKKSHDADDASFISESCQFPGAVIGSMLEALTARKKTQKSVDSSEYTFHSIAYLTIIATFSFSGLRALARLNGIQEFIFALLAGILGVFLFAGLHYANFIALTSDRIILDRPKYTIQSTKILHLIALPFVMIAIVNLYMIVVQVIVIYNERNYLNSGKLSDLIITPMVQLLLVSFLMAVVRAVLRPKSLGVIVDPEASIISSGLAIVAMIFRSPVYFSPVIHRIGLITGIFGGLGFSLLMIGFKDVTLIFMSVFFTAISVYCLIWPSLSFVWALFNLFIVELVHTFLEACKNIAILKEQAPK